VSTITCPSCQRETAVDPTWNYCTKCGSRLTTGNPVGTATAVAARPASTLGYGNPEAVRRGSISAAPAAAASTVPKPGKMYIIFVALVFCTIGAIVGGIAGFVLNVKGPEAAIGGIVVAGVFVYLRNRGAFPDKKKKS
jgi:hypothetical protein